MLINRTRKLPNGVVNKTTLDENQGFLKTKGDGISQFTKEEKADKINDSVHLDLRQLKNETDHYKKVRLIVSSSNQETLNNLKNEGNNIGKVIRDLPIVNGFSMELDSSKVENWLSPYLEQKADVNIASDIFFPAGIPNNDKVDKHGEQTLSDTVKRFISRLLDWPWKYEAGNSSKILENIPMRTIGMDKVWAKGFTGKGVTVAFVDSGVYPHEDFKERIIGWKDMDDPNKITPHDERGHGTHVAGLMVGNGRLSGGGVSGGAPGANLVAIKIKSEFNDEKDEVIAVSEAIAGLQWVLNNKTHYNIKVVNLSIGVTPTTGWKQDLFAQAVEKVIAAGITVVTVAGNENDPLLSGCITSPGIAPSAITVGAIDDQKTVDPDDDNIYYRSSRGPTIDGIPKPDVVAPGVSVWSTLAPGSKVGESSPSAKNYIELTGTSQAAPIVTGLVATLLEANKELTPLEIKEILVESAHTLLDVDIKAQGAGVVDAPKALELALARRKSANAA